MAQFAEQYLISFNVPVMHQSFFGTFPVLCELADGYNPALSPALHNRKTHKGKDSNVKPTGTAGTIEK